MKKPITKWVIIAILILLIAYSGFATYNWLEQERIENRALNNAIDLSDIPLWELSAVGSAAEYLIETDTTGEFLNERITKYFFHARTLQYSSSILRALTNDEKYGLFGTAMFNLNRFFAGLSGDRPDDMKEILTTNLDTLKQMDDTLEEVLRINYLTLADAEKILQLSGNLTAG
jgi:hypothetical protein